MRYRLQRKEQYVHPNTLGNRSFPASDDLNRLEKYQEEQRLIGEKYRIVDVEGGGGR